MTDPNQPTSPDSPRLRISILLAQGCSATSVASMLEVFESINFLALSRGAREARLRVTTVSLDGQPVTASGGVTLRPTHRIDTATEADLVIVPGFLFRIMELLPRLSAWLPWLRQHHAAGSAIATVCTGAFLAAEAGLLDHRRATTHWYYADTFRKRYPKVNLQDSQTVTVDGQLLCSGGATAGNDLLLYLLETFVDRALAREFAKKLLIDSSRTDQSPYRTASFNRRHEDDAIHRVQDWLDQNYRESLQVGALADRFGFSHRNFVRRFKAATRQSPGQYLQNLRLEDAKQRLESSKASFEQITYQVGYEDPNSFRRLFADRVGVSPMDYRRKFQR